MDKSWITKPQSSKAYQQGIQEFIDFAFKGAKENDVVICPCKRCGFRKSKSRSDMFDHLMWSPFPKGYTMWTHHGESFVLPSTISPSTTNIVEDTIIVEDHIQNMINDAFGVDRNNANEIPSASSLEIDQEDYMMPSATQERNEAKEYYELAREGEQPLYEGCRRYSRLSFLVKLYHIKCLCGLSEKSMTMILELIKDAFEYANIPSSFYEAKKSITKLGLNYVKIPACPNNCMLYWGEDEERETCKNCNTSKWKTNEDISVNKKKKKIPAKVLRYFPLKPRLQRLFLSSKTAEDMRWHATDTNNDGILRHPRDSEAWKKFDLTHTWFSSDPRNVRLALASDGFNPFGVMSTNNSIWPVVLIPYNTPPWVCMKQTSFIMSMIIPGKEAPGNNIDVYLQPLVKELKELWTNGVDTYDSFKKEMFKLHANLMWTISDFPGLGALSGWNTYTGLACPSCNFQTTPVRLQASRKWCFMGHRRFLDRRHRFRLNKIRFNGEQEMRSPPRTLSGHEVFEQVKDVEVVYGKKPVKEKSVKRTREGQPIEGDSTQCDTTQGYPQQWKKKSIFFELPYWKDNLLRHNLDPMHIEKNVCDNVLFTLLNDRQKSKDHYKAREDLENMGIRPDLWPDENGRISPAAFSLTGKDKRNFLTTLKNIRVPDGYSSNISRCIDLVNLKVNGMMKSHDCHILMEQLLPLAIRTTLPHEISSVLIELCSFFRQLCAKVLKIEDLEKLQNQIVLTLCHMEMLFPPSFFTVMIHLVVHLVEEVKLGGPVHYRWMYPIERYLGKLKSHVRNKAKPEGSIAEGYRFEEILTFCSRYLENIETRWNQPGRVDDDPIGDIQTSSSVAELFPRVGKPVGGSSYYTLTPIEKLQAHRHVLTNCPIVDDYLKQFRSITQNQMRRSQRSVAEIDKKVHREFAHWFRNRICNNLDNIHGPDKDVLISLAHGPFDKVKRFTAFNVNGFKFRTLERDNLLKTQNSGVFGMFGTRSYSSNSDTQMRFGGVPYYGRLIDIIVLSYDGFTVPMFKCEWANTINPRGIKIDKLGFTSINFTRLLHSGEHEDNEPYIQASEAQMVFYVDDESEQGWSIPVHLKPRDLYDMGGNDEIMTPIEPYPSQNLEEVFLNEDLGTSSENDDNN
ncbi:uncharacterized protein LOC131644106 isoform X1 [Vicia villosa]|uniref:uncharacterized protein LOC131644106 isoform X1 n=1 Tax=Vicia villosa TaxID=3911 RepID=UPI00273B0839|nr:uncharacterized protein LOC131644106 isoform X1 [Vicia villosa]